MSNAKEWAEPTMGYYNSVKHPQFEAVAWIVAVSFFVLGLAAAISGLAWFLLPIPLVLTGSGYAVAKTIRHEAYSFNTSQLEVYRSYHRLPEDIRSKFSLSADSIQKLSEDPASWGKLKSQLETLHNVWKKRKQEEARLDAGAQILFEDIHRAIIEEQQTRDAIKQVLGDKPEQATVQTNQLSRMERILSRAEAHKRRMNH